METRAPVLPEASSPEGRRFRIRGVVQGVGFRPWVFRLAQSYGLTGRVRNDGEGVTIEAFGTLAAFMHLREALDREAPPASRIDAVTVTSIPPEPLRTFELASSTTEGTRSIALPADLPTCDDCLGELFRPDDRRFRYPFIACAQCGPRFTVVHDLPYDRSGTTMARFTQCSSCIREYSDPTDRRFHAQANACPACGPRLILTRSRGSSVVSADPLREIERVVRSGGVVALKGIGGFHLACDATSADAVRLLRRRKMRDAKPFALMVRSVVDAQALAAISDEEARLLASPERPIVLLRKRAETAVVDEVAPGLPWLGIMLAYAPLHHLLLEELGRPLVMTSGNLAGEPIAYRDEDATSRLAALADLMVGNDREIAAPCDDSVARVVAAKPMVLRRSRGWVPRSVTLETPVSEPVLGCGALLKNTFCIAVERTAYLGPHIGDLDDLETFESYRQNIDRLEHFLGVRPEVVAHDLHPDYPSTRYALERRSRRRIAVQHHHAHIAAVMAEHRLPGPVLGIAWDGSGFGTNGASWGSEFMIADGNEFRRLATLRPLALPGGDAAVRQVWRAAAGLLDDAFEGSPPMDRLSLFKTVPFRDLSVIRALARSESVPRGHGAGRLFDEVGALVLGLQQARYEGEVAIALNAVADAANHGTYPWTLHDQQTPWQIDPRPMIRAIVEDVLNGVPATVISARFHDSLADIIEVIVRRSDHGYPSVLTGGCFQNQRLTEAVLHRLADRKIYLPWSVPPGDGGLSLGQTVIAGAHLTAVTGSA